MTKTSNENEQTKRFFFEYLKGARGFTDSTVSAHADAIWKWQEFSSNDDFTNFNKSKAVGFVKWLEERASNTSSGKLAVVSRDNYIRRVKKFFSWLSCQAGFKSKVFKDDVEYLRLSKKDAQAARLGTTKQMPTLDEAKKIIETIQIKNDLDRRDRALISLALITGMRIDAIISLRMKSYDESDKTITQNPADGVRTKNSKLILTTFLPIGWDDPEQHFLEWYAYLKAKGFGSEDPIFPATLSGFGEGRSQSKTNSVAKAFWNSTGSARKIFEKRCLDAHLPYFHPHSFRHLVVTLMEEQTLTEAQKKAISLSLGHSNVGTTFGPGGYGNMSNEDAIKVIKKLETSLSANKDKMIITKEDFAAMERVFKFAKERAPFDGSATAE